MERKRRRTGPQCSTITCTRLQEMEGRQSQLCQTCRKKRNRSCVGQQHKHKNGTSKGTFKGTGKGVIQKTANALLLLGKPRPAEAVVSTVRPELRKLRYKVCHRVDCPRCVTFAKQHRLVGPGKHTCAQGVSTGACLTCMRIWQWKRIKAKNLVVAPGFATCCKSSIHMHGNIHTRDAWRLQTGGAPPSRTFTISSRVGEAASCCSLMHCCADWNAARGRTAILLRIQDELDASKKSKITVLPDFLYIPQGTYSKQYNTGLASLVAQTLQLGDTTSVAYLVQGIHDHAIVELRRMKKMHVSVAMPWETHPLHSSTLAYLSHMVLEPDRERETYKSQLKDAGLLGRKEKEKRVVQVSRLIQTDSHA